MKTLNIVVIAVVLLATGCTTTQFDAIKLCYEDSQVIQTQEDRELLIEELHNYIRAGMIPESREAVEKHLRDLKLTNVEAFLSYYEEARK